MGFQFDPDNPHHRKSNYESRYTLYRLPYQPLAAGQGALRPEIQIETSVWPSRRPSVACSVTSFVAESFKWPPELATIACTSIVETAAKKFAALALSWPGSVASGTHLGAPYLRPPRHPRRITTPRTLACWRAKSCWPMPRFTVTNSPAYRDNPLVETLRAVECIASDGRFAHDYAGFVRDMVYGEAPDFRYGDGDIEKLAVPFT